jgi:hypothetical protein
MSSLLHRRIRRPSAALLVAFAALFTALGGTGYAALMVTGANVANGSLTGADIHTASVGGTKLKLDTVRGSRIKESTLGTVPSADHAATADNAAHATNADKAADADTIDGIDSASLMTDKPRLFEANVNTIDNFGDNATLGTLANLDAGEYLVTAKLTYDNDGVFEQETCTLHVPGSDDSSTFQVGNSETETIHLQEAVSVGAMWAASVSCTADPSDDMIGPLSIIAVRVD